MKNNDTENKIKKKQQEKYIRVVKLDLCCMAKHSVSTSRKYMYILMLLEYVFINIYTYNVHNAHIIL